MPSGRHWYRSGAGVPWPGVNKAVLVRTAGLEAKDNAVVDCYAGCCICREQVQFRAIERQTSLAQIYWN